MILGFIPIYTVDCKSFCCNYFSRSRGTWIW